MIILWLFKLGITITKTISNSSLNFHFFGTPCNTNYLDYVLGKIQKLNICITIFMPKNKKRSLGPNLMNWKEFAELQVLTDSKLKHYLDFNRQSIKFGP